MRRTRGHLLIGLGLAAVMACGTLQAADAPAWLSHAPVRPLPVAANRAREKGPALFVDAAKGDDANDGSEARPWKSVQQAVERLKPGDTLCLRGGVYYEHLRLVSLGAAEKPITIRSFPGELAVIDGGLREFFDSPAASWEPCPGGARGEYQSTKTYAVPGAIPNATNVWGNFGDSMLQLQGYHHHGDLQSDSMFWEEPKEEAPAAGSSGAKVKREMEVYCGPGVWYNPETQRIHARLAHTNLAGLHEDNYAGETDPRRIPLVVAVRGAPVIHIEDSLNLALQDFVVRGAVDSCVHIEGSERITLDGLTTFGGGSAINAQFTKGLRMNDCAVRGPAAPWTFRSSLKYRSVESNLLGFSKFHPVDNSDYDIGYCEFTDTSKGVFAGMTNLKLHHCLFDNCVDDGIFLTCDTTYDGRTPGGNVRIYQNRISRTLTPLVFGVGRGRQKTLANGLKQVGSGVWVFRNVFDQRRPDMYFPPLSAKAPQELSEYGRMIGHHNIGIYEPLFIYQNLVVTMGTSWRNLYAEGLVMAAQPGTKARIFNNIFVQARGPTGLDFGIGRGKSIGPDMDLQADGNLFWSEADGPAAQADVFAQFRKSKVFEESKALYAPGWTANDLFADPKLERFNSEWSQPVNFTLKPGSPAFGAGVPVPPEWPDPLRVSGSSKPAIGPLSEGVKPWGVGVHGRCNPFAYCQ